VLALVAGAPAPASAHAILLRTDPSPETTVTHPPPQVRLEFSESVEVAFGADAPRCPGVTVNGAIVAATS
jgi:methionine-rich copper-binding protein CopC